MNNLYLIFTAICNCIW